MSGSYSKLSWAAPANNGGSAITSYNIYRGTAAGAESATAIGSSATLTYTDTSVAPGKTYYYVVRAVNSVGTSPASNEVVYQSAGTLPSAPTNLAAAQTTGMVSLTWSAPASSGSSAVTSYSVFRGTSSLLTDQVSIASVTTTSYIDTKATVGTYYYTVRAVSAVGSSVASSPLTVVVKAITTVPGAVTGVSAVGSNGAVTLTWSAPSNGGSAITGYKLYRSTVSGSETLLTTLGAVQSYTNTGLTNGNVYYYRVSAINANGEGALSSEVSAKPLGQAATVPGPFTMTATPGPLGVVLKWTTPSTGGSPILRFQVMRTESGVEKVVATMTSSRTGYVDLTAVSGKDYTYRIVCTNAVGSTSTPSVAVHNVLGALQSNAPTVALSVTDYHARMWSGCA